jgi:Ricin-type beta-trefoil lectin domain
MRILPRLASGLAACLLAVGIVLSTGVAAQAEITTPSGGEWAELFNPLLPLVDQQYHVCLDVPGGTTENRHPLQMFHCHGYASSGAVQRWQFSLQWDGSYLITNQSNLLCITAVVSSLTANSGIIEQQTCGSSSGGQSWRLIEFQPGQNFQLESNSPNLHGYCIASGGNYNQSRVYWEPCASDAFQIFALG